ncbi:hypothetical protein C8J56DRAFT_896017 [Mycena floridula]|nr:hypothetical protein C8J56DRAFT_896017 [Mycena floridula]
MLDRERYRGLPSTKQVNELHERRPKGANSVGSGRASALMPALALPCLALESPALRVGQERAEGRGSNIQMPDALGNAQGFGVTMNDLIWFKNCLSHQKNSFNSQVVHVDMKSSKIITRLSVIQDLISRYQGSGIGLDDTLPSGALPCPVNALPCPARPNTRREIVGSPQVRLWQRSKSAKSGTKANIREGTCMMLEWSNIPVKHMEWRAPSTWAN